MKILVVDDDAAINKLVCEYLAAAGFEVKSAFDGRQALIEFNDFNPELLILDVMMPYIDGIKLCEEIRRNSDVPIIMLTARSDENDRVRVLDMGADDYISKPFSPRELLSRAKAVLRRYYIDDVTVSKKQSKKKNTKRKNILIGDFIIHGEKCEVWLNGTVLSLTASEYKILEVFIRKAGVILSRDFLIAELGEKFDGYDRAIDSHIKNLRQKIAVITDKEYIKTVYKLGYRFNL